MREMTTFEQRLAERLQREVSGTVAAFDAGQIAHAAMARRGLRDRLLGRIGLGNALPLPPATRRIIVGLIAAALVLVTVAIAVGFAHLGGPRLAIVRQNGDVIVANADGTGERVIGHVEWDPLRTVVSWAPGGHHLATFGSDWSLSILDPSGRVTFERKLEDRSSQFAWSADGSALAVLDGGWAHDENGSPSSFVDPHLFIVSADGRVEASTDLPPEYRHQIAQGAIAWSRDGRQLAITGYNATTTHSTFVQSIWIVDRGTLDAHEIVPPGGLTYDAEPAWLPDGRVLFARMNAGLWAVDPATESGSTIYTPTCPCSGTTIIPFVLSPDGTRLAMIAPNVGLGILDLGTGAVTDLALPTGFGGDLPIGWTSDGRGLVLRYGPITDQPFYAPDVAILDVATGTVTVIASDVVGYDLRTS